ncbi:MULTISPECIES: alpha/beta hydrolase [unclassified Streptomyces]|uniref:alpha/beta hydrolase n=1 Tax=unclassified Streptomyces TaxID=2593676 RepID=UPI002ED3799F|nr:alpha/beta hydrolase family protein [Streptomyces sp. NBC_00891]WSY06776.1 alpha/beta hydrolase family protein [Streptomyces sp. NBC_00890]WSZ08401.1 alpha/beta hydrolase family protein [Streptomyces sp. NBC_00869]WSZ24101.1 alpha/beta hydrolase family protein [Streptomyces sp. NBC_00870]
MTALDATLTWAQLRDIKCAELESAADGWGSASNRADAGRDRIEKQMLAGLRENQHGAAADAAVGRLRRLGRNLQYVYTECGLVRTALNSLAHDLRVQQTALRRALDEAESLKYTVHPDGSVTYPAGGASVVEGAPLPPGGTARVTSDPGLYPPSGLVGPNPHAAKAQDIAHRIAKAVGTAVEIDWRFARVLRRLKAEEGLKVPDRTWTDAAGDAAAVREAARGYLKSRIPRDASPAARREWWEHLTDEQREEYLAVYPDQIGNLDGIPSLIRDAANRDNLQLLIGKLEGRSDETSGVRLAGLREIQRQLNEGGRPPMYLLGIGDEGNGRAIVSFGNPDTARNVAAYVPGLNTSLDKDFATGDVKRARDTARAAMKYDHSSASMVWLGYDAPQFPDGLSSFAVAGDDRAVKGGGAFNQFMAGLAATNAHDDPHMTAIGHSYGSRTVGAATQQGGGIPGVDDIVLVGSPGVGVDRAEDLGVGKNHVFVGAAENDIVTKVPSHRQAAAGLYAVPGGPLASYLFGDAADQGDDDLWFGKDPASEAFGARRFPVAPGPRPVGLGGLSIDAHSGYFDVDPERDAVSADSIALIAAGKADKVKVEEGR